MCQLALAATQVETTDELVSVRLGLERLVYELRGEVEGEDEGWPW